MEWLVIIFVGSVLGAACHFYVLVALIIIYLVGSVYLCRSPIQKIVNRRPELIFYWCGYGGAIMISMWLVYFIRIYVL